MFQEAIGQKISALVMTFSLIIASFVFAFITGWLLAIVATAMIPAMIITGLIFAMVVGHQDKYLLNKYRKSASRAS